MKQVSDIRICTLFLLVALVSGFLNAQENLNINRKTYRAWIMYKDKSHVKSGILHEIQDSSLVLYKSSIVPKYNHQSNENFNDSTRIVLIPMSLPGHVNKQIFTTIKYDRIDIVKLRRKSKVGKGIIIGALSGLMVGAVSAFSMSNQEHPPEKIIPMVIIPTGIGVGLGAIIGCLKVSIPINGLYILFDSQRVQLRRYAKIKKGDQS